MKKYAHSNRLLGLELKHKKGHENASRNAVSDPIYYTEDNVAEPSAQALSRIRPQQTIRPQSFTLTPNDFYIKEDGTILTIQGNSNSNRYFLQKRPVSAECYEEILTLESNNINLVLFPDNGLGFNRYGTVDAGGSQGGVVYGAGDHYCLPETAAALLGLCAFLNREYNFTLSLGDMSSSNGQDPWQPGFQHHAGHGHGGNRVGKDADFRYLNANGVSFQSNNAFQSSNYNQLNNQRVFDTARRFGFTSNYQGNSGDLSNVTKANGHNDHGHLGLEHDDMNWRYVPNPPGQVVSLAMNAPKPFPSVNSDRFREFLPTIFRFEGGFVNDPADPGGATNRGITIQTFRRHAMQLLGMEPTLDNLRAITEDQAAKIYEAAYWNEIMGDQINDTQVAYQFVDFHINSSMAIEIMQSTLNQLGARVAENGIMDFSTLEAINAMDGNELFNAYKTRRQDFYNGLVQRKPEMEKFLNGWTRRTEHFVYQNSMFGKSLSHLHTGLLTHSNGWLDVIIDGEGRRAVSQFVRVSDVSWNPGRSRQLFTIDDWPFAGKKASVSAKPGGGSRFGDVNYQDEGTVTFEPSNSRLKFGNSGWFPTTIDASNPLSDGTYDLWLPDHPHAHGSSYSHLTPYSKVWFRIGAENSDRYLHVGNYSLGCVSFGATSASGTDADKRQWTELYNYLIKRRRGNGGRYVGKLVVQ